MPFFIHDSAGRISRVILTDSAEEAARQCGPGEAMAAGQGGDATHWVSGGAVVERPSLGVSQAMAAQSGVDLVVPGIPDGTRVYIDGDFAGATDAEGLVLAFPDAGVRRVDLDPPFPYRECEIVVDVA